jgi:hypothetical protein
MKAFLLNFGWEITKQCSSALGDTAIVGVWTQRCASIGRGPAPGNRHTYLEGGQRQYLTRRYLMPSKRDFLMLFFLNSLNID